MKKRKKKSNVKKLQEKAHKLWWEYCFKRDGGICQVRKYFPGIKINHSEVIQIDHCFSRMNREIFLDVANGTTVCGTCNMIKGSGKIGASRRDAVTVAVHEIVKKREGEDTYKRLFEVGSKCGAFLDWKRISWLELQIQILEEMLNENT